VESITSCPKFLRNGPCGGYEDGMCEVHRDKKCFFINVYEKLKAAGRLDEFRKIKE